MMKIPMSSIVVGVLVLLSFIAGVSIESFMQPDHEVPIKARGESPWAWCRGPGKQNQSRPACEILIGSLAAFKHEDIGRRHEIGSNAGTEFGMNRDTTAWPETYAKKDDYIVLERVSDWIWRENDDPLDQVIFR